MGIWLIVQIVGSSIYFVIMMCMLSEYPLEEMLEALFSFDTKACFLWSLFFFTGLFLFLLLMFTYFIHKIRQNPENVTKKMKDFGIIKNDSPIDLRYDLRIEVLENKIKELEINIQHLELKNSRKN